MASLRNRPTAQRSVTEPSLVRPSAIALSGAPLAAHPQPSPRADLRDEVLKNVGDGLNKALAALEQANTSLDGVVAHIDFNRKVGQSTISDKKLRDLIDHFSEHRLRNEDFEYPDLLGAAYEYLIRDFADSAGKKGGEFYTPRPVVRMMVQIAQPTEGDVLVSHKGTIGETAIVPASALEVMLTPQVTYYRCNSVKLDPIFLLSWMRTESFQTRMKQIAGQSTREYVGITGQRSLLMIPVPPRAEQELISVRAREIESRIRLEAREAEKLRRLKRGLMEDLLTGRVRVTDLLEKAA